MNKTAINRQQLGLAIANIPGTVKRISDSIYRVDSQSGNGDYEIHLTDLGWVCSCPDHTYRGAKCKHIFAVEISFALHKEVEVARIEPIDIGCCIYCKSVSIVKDGLRYNKYGAIQKFNCRACSRYFTINLGFEKMHATPQMITSALQLYFTNTFITDGAPNFHDAFNKEFWTRENPRTRHIQHIRLQGDHNNNKMERMNGEVRDREKVMRGLKIQSTAILPGYQIYHNYFRPHEALKGKTPAEKCGIREDCYSERCQEF
jgi:transposase-like protein